MPKDSEGLDTFLFIRVSMYHCEYHFSLCLPKTSYHLGNLAILYYGIPSYLTKIHFFLLFLHESIIAI